MDDGQWHSSGMSEAEMLGGVFGNLTMAWGFRHGDFAKVFCDVLKKKSASSWIFLKQNGDHIKRGGLTMKNWIGRPSNIPAFEALETWILAWKIGVKPGKGCNLVRVVLLPSVNPSYVENLFRNMFSEASSKTWKHRYNGLWEPFARSCSMVAEIGITGMLSLPE